MALITCPNCGKQVSSRATSCPNCGCPITEMELPTTTYKATIYRRSYRGKFNRWLLEASLQHTSLTGSEFQQGDHVCLLDQQGEVLADLDISTYAHFQGSPSITFGFDNLDDEIAKRTASIVKTTNEASKVETNNQVRCPRCGSTQIQVVPRKYTIWAGFATNKVDRVCLNCKNKF